MLTLRRALPLLAALALSGPAAAQQVVRLPERDRPLAGQPTPIFSVGAEEGESWEMLSNAEQVAFDRADNLYVLDRGNGRVLVFDPRGRFVRQIGKKGQGPGEFEVPVALSVLPDGALAVLDLAHQNVSVFAADGALRRTYPWRQEWGMPGRQLAAHPDGGLVALLRPMLRFDRGRAVQTGTQSFNRLTLGAGEAETAKMFDIPDFARVQGSRTTAPGGGQSEQIRMMGPPEFSALTLWGVLGDGNLVLSNGSNYNVRIMDAAGTTTRYLVRPVPVRRTTERDRERARARRREMLQSGRGAIVITRGGGGPGGPAPRNPFDAAAIERQLAQMEFSDTIRAVQGLLVTPTGKIWVERTPALVGDPGPIDLLTAQGQYLGTITGQRLPAAVSASGRAAYLERD
ncbi:MAG TPA: 6-bladed beta-propeller, partial [Longimicrobium sp.]|nr:6-bladed beta-propeller [Longimicrobium sp.]